MRRHPQGDRTPNVLGTCVVHCVFCCLCDELLLPEPSPLKRLGFFMSKVRLKSRVRTRIINDWRLIAIDKLKQVGILFEKQPKNAVIEYLIKEHNLEVISLGVSSKRETKDTRTKRGGNKERSIISR